MPLSNGPDVFSTALGVHAFAPRLVVKRTFLEFDLRGKGLSRSCSDSHIGQLNDSYSELSVKLRGFDSEEDSGYVRSTTGSGSSHVVEICSDGDDCFPEVPEASCPDVPPCVTDCQQAMLSDSVKSITGGNFDAERSVAACQKTKPDSQFAARQRAMTWHPSSGAISNKSTALNKQAAGFTTIMLRNLPLWFTRSMTVEMLDAKGFQGTYDFLYLPINFNTGLGFGYAFVNFVSCQHAGTAMKQLHGFSDWGGPCDEVCQTSWSDPHQGLAANVARYRNSPLMHASVPDDHKPILLGGGARRAFPPPSRKIKAPKAVHRTTPAARAAAWPAA